MKVLILFVSGADFWLGGLILSSEHQEGQMLKKHKEIWGKKKIIKVKKKKKKKKGKLKGCAVITN